MKTQIITLLFLMSVAVVSNGQKPKFKKITKAELEQSVCEYDSTANAEYLYHGCSVSFVYNEAYGKFEVIYSFHDRIKIYDENGIGLADHVLSYYKVRKGKESEDISELEAYTFNLENGKIVEEKLKKDNIFKEKRSELYSTIKFAMPGVKAGSVLDIKYELTSPYYFRIDEFYFQKDVPVNYTEYEIRTPEYYNYNYNIKGLVNLDVEESQKQGRVNYSYNTRTHTNRTSKLTTKFETLTYNENVKKYTASKVPGIKKESYVYSMDNFKGSIRLELLFTKFPKGGVDYYTKTWDDIAVTLDKSENFGDQLGKNYKGMNQLLKEVESMKETEKIATIYYRIQQKFTWDSKSSNFTDKGIKKLLERGTGNSAEINLLLVNVLQKAGIQAFPMVYKKRDSGYLNYSNPTLAELDYVVAVIAVNNIITYLDATDKNLNIDMLPPRALNLKGVVMMGKKGQEVSIQNHNKGSESKVYTLVYDGESLTGTYKQRTKGFEAYYDRSNYKTTEDYIKDLQKEDVIFSNTEIKNFDIVNKPISIVSDIVVKGCTQEVEDKIFLDLMVGQEEFKNPFESETRDFSLFFNSKVTTTKMIKVKIPEGYQVEYVPEMLNIATPEGYIRYSVKAQVVGEEIVTTIRSSINETMISPEYYESVRLIYDRVAAISKEKIVLSKM